MNFKITRLTKEEVIWLNCLLLALLVSRFGLGSYSFANELLDRFSMLVFALLFVFLAVVIFMGPQSMARRISLLLAIPIAILASLVGCAGATNFNKHPDVVEVVGQAGDVTFELVEVYEITYYDICKYWIELRMRRPLLNGILKEQATLITVHPAFSAQAELIDKGKNIRFTSPALLGRKAIVRIYSTDWDKARKNGAETIPLTKAEQGL